MTLELGASGLSLIPRDRLAESTVNDRTSASPATHTTSQLVCVDDRIGMARMGDAVQSC